MNFGEKLQSLRKNKGFSQEQLADQLNVSRQAVSKWETGDGYPELDKLIQISNLFEVSLDYLVKTQELKVEEPEVTNVEIEPEVVEKVVEDPNEEEKIRPITKEELQFTDIGEIEDYIDGRNRFASKVGLGVMIIIGSIIFPIVLEYMENLAAGLMFVVMGAGIGLIVTSGINYSHIRKPELILSVSDHSYFMAEFEEVRNRFAKKIAFGVFLVLAGVAAAAIGEDLLSNDNLGSGLMFVFVGLAVYIFITAGLEYETYKTITNGDTVEVSHYTTHQPKTHRKRIPLAESSVPIYLILGFIFHLWHPGWLVFPIFGILDGIINNS